MIDHTIFILVTAMQSVEVVSMTDLSLSCTNVLTAHFRTDLSIRPRLVLGGAPTLHPHDSLLFTSHQMLSDARDGLLLRARSKLVQMNRLKTDD